VVEFGEWLCEEVLKAVPHRHFVFSIPKILRRYFLYDRKLLSDLSRCGWDSLKAFFQETIPDDNAVPGAVIAIQTFGDFLGFNPHLHILCTDGCFYGQGLSACDAQAGMFHVTPFFELKHLEEIFRHKVFRMLLSKGKIIEDIHSTGVTGHLPVERWKGGKGLRCLGMVGGHACLCVPHADRCSHPPALPDHLPMLMELHSDGDKLIRVSNTGQPWRAGVPNKGEQMVRYYGYYSNVSRGKRKREDQDDRIPSILEPEGSSGEYRKNWARLIQKIYEIDPLMCPKCQGRMRIIAFIEDDEVIKKILKHLGLPACASHADRWEIKQRPPPKSTGPPKPPDYSIDYSVSQLPGSDNWLYADPVYPEASSSISHSPHASPLRT